MNRFRFAAASLAVSGFCLPLAQAEAPHEHGAARLNIAIDGSEVLLELQSPCRALQKSIAIPVPLRARTQGAPYPGRSRSGRARATGRSLILPFPAPAYRRVAVY